MGGRFKSRETFNHRRCSYVAAGFPFAQRNTHLGLPPCRGEPGIEDAKADAFTVVPENFSPSFSVSNPIHPEFPKCDFRHN